MDTEKYKILIKTIQTGSLSVAAEELGYTPSGVSRAISSLEEEADIALVSCSRVEDFNTRFTEIYALFKGVS